MKVMVHYIVQKMFSQKKKTHHFKTNSFLVLTLNLKVITIRGQFFCSSKWEQYQNDQGW